MMREFWKWVAKRAIKYAGIPLRDPALVAMFGGEPADAGIDVTEDSALNCSTVFAAVRLISQSLASLPLVLDERTGGRITEAFDHPVHDLLLESPNAEMTPIVFYETVQAHALTWGNGYARIYFDGDVPCELYPLKPNQMEPTRHEETGEIHYAFTAMLEGEEDELIPAHEVLHIPGLGFDGLQGYSVIQRARQAIGLSLATEKFGATLFGRGTLPGGIITHPGELEETAKTNLRESWELLYRGPENSHRVCVLDEGMTWAPMSLPPEDAQFLQTRQFQLTEIARWFDVPPHLLRDLSQATYSNIEHQGIDFLTYTLRPWLVRWQQEIRRKLIKKAERRKLYATHKTKAFLATDTAARYTSYKAGREGGWLALNDILTEEGMNPIDPRIGGTHLIPQNMSVLEDSLPEEGGEDVVAVDSSEDAAGLAATVGGSQQIMALQTAFFTKALPREACIANAIIVFGFSPEDAEKLFPQMAFQAVKASVP